MCCKYNSEPNTSPWSQLTAWGSLGYPLPSFHKHLFPGTVPGTKDQSQPAWWSIRSRRADRSPSNYKCDKHGKRKVPCIGAEYAWDLTSPIHLIWNLKYELTLVRWRWQEVLQRGRGEVMWSGGRDPRKRPNTAQKSGSRNEHVQNRWRRMDRWTASRITQGTVARWGFSPLF